MPRIVSSIKKHITTTEFWRALSFVLKRLESTAKFLTKLPLFFTYHLYILQLIRSGLRIFDYFYKTKNKNLGSTCKLLFAVFKVSIAIIALVLLGCGVPLPAILLTAFFAYTLLKLSHSAIVLLASTISYLKIDKNCIEQHWERAQYRQNINKHVYISAMILSFMLLTRLFIGGTRILVWSNPLLLLTDIVIYTVLMAGFCYLTYKIAKNKRHENLFLKMEEIATIKKFLLLFGVIIVALLLIAATPSLGASAITAAMIILCIQDVLLTIYYYFFDDRVPNPEPANLTEEQLNTRMLEKNQGYYHTLFPTYYLQTQPSKDFPSAEDVIKRNKKILLKVTFVQVLELENKLNELEETSKLRTVSNFFSPQKKLNIKKKYLLKELAWALNTDNQEVLIDLFIRAIIDIPESKRSPLFENNLSELMDLIDFLGVEAGYFIDYEHPQLNKNFIAQLFFMAKQKALFKFKSKDFFQSFKKKIGACEACSLGYQASWNIEEDQLNLPSPSWRPI